MQFARNRLREARIRGKQILGIEPYIKPDFSAPLEFHGNENGGWSILAESLSQNAVVVDVGLGEDVSFSESIIRRYGCVVHGFDPTPRAIRYAAQLGNPSLRVFERAVGAKPGTTRMFLPLNEGHVSGSIIAGAHLNVTGIPVEVVSMDEVFELVGAQHIDVLKIDIEGAEFDLIESEGFQKHAADIKQLCVEFHHRWDARGKDSTIGAVTRLKERGFRCLWYARATNEEFLFVHESALAALPAQRRRA